MYYPSYITSITIVGDSVQALCDAFDRNPEESSFETCLELLSDLELTEILALLEAGKLDQSMTVDQWRQFILEASYDFVSDGREVISHFIEAFPEGSRTLRTGWSHHQSLQQKMRLH